MKRPRGKAPTFEAAIEQLEQITNQIESGQIGLQKSLKQYEQGMKLISHCRTILDMAENRIAALNTDGHGHLTIDGAVDQPDTQEAGEPPDDEPGGDQPAADTPAQQPTQANRPA